MTSAASVPATSRAASSTLPRSQSNGAARWFLTARACSDWPSTVGTHDRLLAMRVDVLLHLDGEHLGLGHLVVEELDHRAQLGRHRVGDEHEPQSARADVGCDLLPEPVLVGRMGGQQGISIPVFCGTALPQPGLAWATSPAAFRAPGSTDSGSLRRTGATGSRSTTPWRDCSSASSPRMRLSAHSTSIRRPTRAARKTSRNTSRKTPGVSARACDNL